MFRRRSNDGLLRIVGWTVVAHTREHSIEGKVAEVTDTTVELHGAKYLDAATPEELKGCIVVERPIGFVQLVGAPA